MQTPKFASSCFLKENIPHVPVKDFSLVVLPALFVNLGDFVAKRLESWDDHAILEGGGDEDNVFVHHRPKSVCVESQPVQVAVGRQLLQQVHHVLEPGIALLNPHLGQVLKHVMPVSLSIAFRADCFDIIYIY